MELNPYTPTKASLQEPGTQADAGGFDEAKPASRERRLVNFLIDSVGLMIFIFLITVVIAAVDASFVESLSLPASYLLNVLATVLFYMPAELLTGRTPGKLVTRTRVISKSGGRPTALQILGRTLLRLVPLEAFTFFARGPGLHDRGSGTRVVMTRKD